ncbi:bleomycin resistance protein [Scytonema sp. UIC 10036]|uniref:VOC family protein n=1 Tax=Scytonema sp. UIC 10036 TaxID=2304196 RepID=UPI0012DA1851|nr:VOC family protein [Scytonema sp. UIC 10036]MUG92143.1 bleomycin resistance protein [Scytonema sp. UIC 10036]
MTLGTINHLSLTVSDRSLSEPFYDQILQFMGYQQVERNEEFTMWWQQNAGAILIYNSRPDSPNKIHDRYSPGLHHLAFNAESREQVDKLYQIVLDMGGTILDSPAEYNHYAPGYYAFFFADPDGIKLEFVHMPNLP